MVTPANVKILKNTQKCKASGYSRTGSTRPSLPSREWPLFIRAKCCLARHRSRVKLFLIKRKGAGSRALAITMIAIMDTARRRRRTDAPPSARKRRGQRRSGAFLDRVGCFLYIKTFAVRRRLSPSFPRGSRSDPRRVSAPGAPLPAEKGTPT